MEEFEDIIQKHVNTLLNEFKKCKSKKKYIELLSIFYIIDEIINNIELFIDYKNDFQYELTKFNIEKYDKAYESMFLNNYNLMFDYNVKLSNLYSNLSKNKLNVIEYKDYIEMNDTIKMVQLFFENYDMDLLKYFNNQILGNGLLILTDKVEGGQTYLSNYIFPPYSFVNPRLCAKDYITIIHETAHNYIRNRLRYINYNQLNQMLVNNLEEVYPIFLELCAIKFANSNSLLRDLGKYEQAMISSMCTYLEKYNKNLLNNEIINYVVNESYAYGFIMAYHYYDLYNINPEETKNKVLKLSLDLPYYNKEYLLNNYGINQIDLLNNSKSLNNIK